MFKVAAIVLMSLLALAAVIGVTSASTTDDRDMYILSGGPGSLTLNWEPAPPGTFIYVRDGLTSISNWWEERVKADGSWSLSIQEEPQATWNIYLDGFLVPKTQYAESIAIGQYELSLDTGYYYDPEPEVVYLHVDRITVFGQPALPGTEVCLYAPYGIHNCWSWEPYYFIVGSQREQYTFTVASIPVANVRVDLRPELAPFRLSLEVGDPTLPTVHLFGAGNVRDLTDVCGKGYIGPTRMYASDGNWTTSAYVQRDGDWQLLVPATEAPITLWADAGEQVRTPPSENAIEIDIRNSPAADVQIEDSFLVVPQTRFSVVVRVIGPLREPRSTVTVRDSQQVLRTYRSDFRNRDKHPITIIVEGERNTNTLYVEFDAMPEDLRTVRIEDYRYRRLESHQCAARVVVTFEVLSEAQAHAELERIARMLGSL